MANEENKVKKQKSGSRSSLFVITLIGLLVFSVWVNVLLGNSYNKLLTDFDSTLTELHKTDSQLTECKKQKEKPIDLISLKEDINQYIKTYYKRVPKIIRSSIADEVINKSNEYNFSPELLVGIIEVESSFDPMAVSSKKARGLMQIMPEWVSKINLDSEFELHDIDKNIEAGIKIFFIHLEEEGGDLNKALYKYVGGNNGYSSKVLTSTGKFVAFRKLYKKEEEKINESETEQ